MRLFTEEDVALLIRAAQVGARAKDAQEVIHVAVASGQVHPFELIESQGSHDQGRAFAEWLRTGEVPQRRPTR